MFWAGSTTYAVNNCFWRFIYCFIGWIKYNLLLCIQDLRSCTHHWYKHSSHPSAFGFSKKDVTCFKR